MANTKEFEVEPLDFTSFVMAISSAALSYIDNKNKPKEAELALLFQNIKVLKMLQAKTEGNLTSSENLLVDKVLSELIGSYKKWEA